MVLCLSSKRFNVLLAGTGTKQITHDGSASVRGRCFPLGEVPSQCREKPLDNKITTRNSKKRFQTQNLPGCPVQLPCSFGCSSRVFTRSFEIIWALRPRKLSCILCLSIAMKDASVPLSLPNGLNKLIKLNSLDCFGDRVPRFEYV